MGLLDLSGDSPGLGLFSQSNLPGLALAASLLSGKRGDDIGAKVGNYANSLMLQQNMERQNRANDLQQVQGVYNLLKQQEPMRMLQARQQGVPFTPNPMIPQLEKRIADLSGLGNLSGMAAPQYGMPPQAPPQPNGGRPVGVSAASMTAGGFPQPAQGQVPQGGAYGGPAFGIDPLEFMATDPTGKSYLDALVKQGTPISTRYGVYTINPRNPSQVQLAGGMVPPNAMPVQMGPGGPSIGALPGQLDTAAQLAAANAAGAAYGKLPYATPQTVQTKGAPTLMTVQQMIENATGRPIQTPQSAPQTPAQAPQSFPSVTPQDQATRNATQIKMLEAELASAPTPEIKAAITMQLTALRRGQQTNQPFTSTAPQAKPAGLELQDQGSSAAQREMGQGIGKEAANVFTTGAASVQAKRQLAIMSDMAKNYTPGVLQPLKAQLGRYLASIPGVSEDDVNAFLKTNIGDIQGLTSSAIAMAGKLTRQSDAQPSQLQFFKTLESMPMADRTAQGFQKIMDYLNSMHDYNIDKMVALQQWLNDPKNQGDPTGFEAAWAQKAKTMPLVWNTQAKAANDPLIVTAPDGSQHRFPSTAAATAFRRAIGQ